MLADADQVAHASKRSRMLAFATICQHVRAYYSICMHTPAQASTYQHHVPADSSQRGDIADGEILFELCHGLVMASALALPWQCMTVQWHFRGIAMALAVPRFVIAMHPQGTARPVIVIPWHGRGIAMHSHCTGMALKCMNTRLQQEITLAQTVWHQTPTPELQNLPLLQWQPQSKAHSSLRKEARTNSNSMAIAISTGTPSKMEFTHGDVITPSVL